MSSSIIYQAVNSKTKALSSTLLKRKDYENLLKSDNYRQTIKILGTQTHYKKLLSSHDLDKIHRSELEMILKNDFHETLGKLRHYFYNNYRKFYDIFYMKTEVENIKIILRGKLAGRSSSYLQNRLLAENSRVISNVDYQKLINASSMKTTIDNLRGTIYYKAVKPFANNIEKNGLFRTENALDFVYYKAVRTLTSRLDSKDQKVVKDIIGTQIDLINMQLIYRAKTYHKLTPEEILNYTIYWYNDISKNDIKDFTYAKDSEELRSLIKKTKYREIVENIDGTKKYLMEEKCLAYEKKIFRKYLRRESNDIGTVLSYLELLEIEIRDVISIIEAKRYNIHSEDLTLYIKS